MSDWILPVILTALCIAGTLLFPAFMRWLEGPRSPSYAAGIRTALDNRYRLNELEHQTWPDQTPEWFNHQLCNRCSGGHTHSLSIEALNPSRSKVVRLPPKVGEPTTWIEVTALGDARKYYVPGGPI
jgi:hypothetical protein